MWSAIVDTVLRDGVRRPQLNLNDEEGADKQRSGVEYLGPFDQHVRKALRHELAW